MSPTCPAPIRLTDWDFPGLPAPMLGEHTVEVLRTKLDYSNETIGGLVDRGVVGTGPAGNGVS